MAGRNPNGSGSIRKRSDGRWEARYTTGNDPGTGKQIQKSVYGKTQAEVRKKLLAVCSEIDEGVYTDPSKLTVKGWLEIWLAEYIGSVKEHTKASYEVQVRVHLVPALGAVKLRALTAPAIQIFYNKLLKGEKPLAAKTVRNIGGVLHKALSQAQAIGYIKSNPCDFVILPRLEKKEIRPFEPKQTKAFLDAIKGQDYELLISITLFTGMRQAEIMGLTWDRIDFDKGTIRIDRQLIKEKKKGGKYKFAPPKNNKPRTIKTATRVMQLLKERKRQQAEHKLIAGTVWINEAELKNLVFTNEIGMHLAHHTVYKHFKKAAKAIGLDDSCFHDLRHTYAVSAIQAGDDIKTLSENLGHATVAFTLDVYGHVTEQMKERSSERMDRFIEEISKL